MRRHYRPATFAYDDSWVARARRAGTLDAFHGYPKQSGKDVAIEEYRAYEHAYANTARAGE
jgi:hypothetical protein